MRPRSADSSKNVAPQSRKGRQGARRGLRVIGYLRFVIGGERRVNRVAADDEVINPVVFE
jgi:hypothetical protein